MINFKLYLRNEGTTDVRRFSVDDSAVTNFMFMKEKIQTIFPQLRNTTFKITWKDHDNDEITIVNDEDLITAYTEMDSSMKMLYVTVLEQKEPEAELLFELCDAEPMQQEGRISHVVCDGCEKGITGYRYKCMQCPDYDLCAGCEQKGLHSNHIMMRLSQQELPRCMPKLMAFLSRSIRKAGINASKEAYRAARHCHRAASASCPSSGKDNKSAKTDNKGGCPMEGMVYDFAGPILEALHGQNRQPSTSTGGAETAANPDVLGDIVRNVISNIFGGFTETAQANPTAQSTQTPPSTPNPTATPNSTPVFPSPQNNGSPQNGEPNATTAPQNPTAPMEVESSKPESIYPKMREILVSNEKPAEPGWTFVPPAPQPQSPLSGEDAKIAEGLAQLLDMGFSKDINLEALLRRFHGNVGQVVRYLFESNIIN